MDSVLLTKALNYHGQELLRAIEEEQGIEKLRCIDLRTLDYHEYHKRAKEFGFKERQKRQKLFRFIGKKASMLYTSLDSNDVTSTFDIDSEELCAVMPPLETFMSVPASERRHHFVENLKKYDLVVGQVTRIHDAGLNVQLICMDGGKKRDIADLGIKVSSNLNFCGVNSVLDEFQVKDYVRAVVLDVSTRVERIKIAMKTQLLSFYHQQQQVKLGVISEEEIPVHYKKYLAFHGQTYDQVIHNTLGFCNPDTVGHMCELVGLSRNHSMSLMCKLYKATFPQEEYALELRQAQSAKWAYRSVRDGVAYFKAGNQVEAFQCLNKALQIHSENVEALVARGALFANNSNFRRALEDFEKALELDPKHVNGKKYMSETLVALGRHYEEKSDLEEAEKTYKRAININTDSVNAQEALLAMEMREKRRKSMVAKEQVAAPPPPTRTLESIVRPAPYSTVTDTRDKLKILLKEEKRDKYASPPTPERGVSNRKRAWSPGDSEERQSDSVCREKTRRITKERVEEEPYGVHHQQHKKKISSSSSSSSSSTSSSRSSTSSSSSSSERHSKRELSKPPSPKVVFVMRKDDDLHYSKLYTHAAFREDEDEPSKQASDSGHTSHDKDYDRSASDDSDSDDQQSVQREKRAKRHYRSRHSSSDSADESPERSRHRHSSRESPSPRRDHHHHHQQYHHHRPHHYTKPYYRDNYYHSQNRRFQHRFHHNQRFNRGRGRPFRGRFQPFTPRRGGGGTRWMRGSGVVISRAPDIEALKRLQKEKQERREKKGSSPTPTKKTHKTRVSQNWEKDSESMSAARAAAARIDEALRATNEGSSSSKKAGTLTKLVKDYDSAGEELGEGPSKQSLAAMESFLDKLRAQKKADLLATNKDARKKP